MSKKPGKSGGGRSTLKKSGPHLYTLEVLLTDGPVTEDFVKANPTVSRTIQIRGDQTLEELHGAIEGAFDRDDDHLYGFFLPDGRSKDAGKEVAPGALISSLNPRVGKAFRYHFDFGDDWLHDVKVTAVGDPEDGEKYPKVIHIVGESPPQYPDVDDDDWDEDDEEEGPADLTEGAADVSLLIGEMHFKEGEYARAVEAFTRAIEANPEAADEYEGRARAYRALAEADEQRARELREAPPA